MWHKKIELKRNNKRRNSRKIVEEYASKKQVYNMTDIKRIFAMITADAKTTKNVYLHQKI